MRALLFSMFVILIYVSVLILGYAVIVSGHGLPIEYTAYYGLDGLGLMYGMARQSDSPLIYEWVMTGILKPGKTMIKVGLQPNITCENGVIPVEITVSSQGKSISVNNSTIAELIIDRDNVLVVTKVKISFNTTQCNIKVDRLEVYVESKYLDEGGAFG